MASVLRNLWVGGKLFKSKTDSKPQHVRLKPSNSLLFLSLTDYLTVIILFQGFQMFSKEDHKKRLPVWLLLGKCFNKELTEKKKKHRNLQKLSLSSNSTISPRWHHNCLDQRRHHKQPAPVSGGKIFDRTCSTKTKKLSKQRNWGFLGKDILNKNFQLFAGILFLAQFFFLEIHCWLFWFN